MYSAAVVAVGGRRSDGIWEGSGCCCLSARLLSSFSCAATASSGLHELHELKFQYSSTEKHSQLRMHGLRHSDRCDHRRLAAAMEVAPAGATLLWRSQRVSD